MQKLETDGGVQALVLAMRMLEKLAFAGRPGRVTELANSLGTSKNRIHRHLQTLVEMGYVEQDVDTQSYHTGIRLAQLGSAAASRVDLVNAARPIMHRVQKALGQTLLLSKVDGSRICVIDQISKHPGQTVRIPTGDPLTLHASAQGKLVLAFGRLEMLDEVIAAGLKAQTPYTIVDAEALRREVKTVRTRGWATAPNETMVGLNGVATPILDPYRRITGTLAILGSLDEVSPRPGPHRIAEMKSAATEISTALFHHG
jgi:DNA-binding IclR family transcriptional regulator